MWQQLVSPNLSVQGRIGWCLEYARKVYNTPIVEPTAWNAWNNTKFKHLNRDFPPVAIPLWFIFYQGATNFGHVAIRLPDGKIYSSPWRVGTTHAVLSSIAELERIYGAKYVGWSEDISTVRVVINKEEEIMTPNEGDVHNAYLKANGRNATAEELKVYTSKPWSAPDGLYYGKVLVDLERFKNATPPDFVKVGEVDGKEIFRKK